MMGWYSQDGGGWWMLFMPAVWIAFLGIAIWIVVRLTRPRVQGSQSPPTSEDVLRRRLAAGAVTIEEYRRTHAALHGGHAP